MRVVGSTCVMLIVAFWATMNSLVIWRQYELEKQDRYRAGVADFLGNGLFRERWLEVYKRNRKIGYTGYIYEKVFAEEGIEIQTSLESRMDLDILGKQLPVRLAGNLALDAAMKPLRLRLEVTLAEQVPFVVTGEPRGEEFLVRVLQGSATIFQLAAPRSTFILGDGLVPSLPVSGYRVGERYRIHCFDPIFMSRSMVEVEVVSREIKEIDGLQTEVFCIQTQFRGMTSKSWVNGSGELLRQEFGPPMEDIVLRRVSRSNAKRFFER